MKFLKFILLATIVAFSLTVNAQSIGGTETFRLVDGDTIWSATMNEVKTFIGAAAPGAANQLVVTNDAGTALENATLSVGTAGTDVNLDQTGATVVINVPDAGAAARGAVTTASQTFAGLKSFSEGSTHTGQAAVEAVNMIGVGQYKYDALSANTTLDGTNNMIGLNASGGAFTVTLPAAATAGEWVYTFTVIDGTNLVTIDANAAETFLGGATQKVLSGTGTTLRIQSTGTLWVLVD